MRILLAHPGAELYGSDRMAVAAAKALVDAGHVVTAVLPTQGPLEALFKEAGASVTILNLPVLRKSLLKPTSFLRLVARMPRIVALARRALKDVGAEVAYVNTITQPWWLAAARLTGTPSLVHVREAETEISPLAQRVLTAPLALANQIVANSESTRTHLGRQFKGLLRKSRVVYNGKDWAAYFRADFKPDVTSPNLVFVGRLSPRKGPDVAIKALAEVIEGGVDARLVLVGSIYPGYEWYETELRELVADLGLVDQVEFAGFQADPGYFLETATVALVPSRVEPFGTVAAEGMAAGRPTIVSSIDGLTEIVDSDAVGRRFEVGDHVKLAQAITELIHDPELARRIAATGRESVLSRFSLQAYDAAVVDAVETTRKTRR